MSELNISDYANDLSEEDLTAEARPGLAEGFYNFLVQGSTASVSASGRGMLILEIRAVNEEGDTVGPKLRKYLLMPFRLPSRLQEDSEKTGGVVKDTAGPSEFIKNMARRYVTVTAPSLLPEYPRWDKETKEWTLGGETISREEANERIDEVKREVAKYLSDIYFNRPEGVVGNTFIGKVSYKDDNDRFGQVDIFYSLPKDEEFVV